MLIDHVKHLPWQHNTQGLVGTGHVDGGGKLAG